MAGENRRELTRCRIALLRSCTFEPLAAWPPGGSACEIARTFDQPSTVGINRELYSRTLSKGAGRIEKSSNKSKLNFGRGGACSRMRTCLRVKFHDKPENTGKFAQEAGFLY